MKPFRVLVDASQAPIGGRPRQLDEDGQDKVIALLLTKLSDAEANYSVDDRKSFVLV